MDELTPYVNSALWLSLFSEQERGHVLNFWYNLLAWMQRDAADELRLMPDEFVWSKNGEVVGRFSITVPEPKPTFIEQLLMILDRDITVQKYLHPIKDDKGRFSFTPD
ncbi:MAG: hypothetical protein J0L63_17150 [Anaerolineae bacterium]|nr:hypothetical protein [Anaerolineae bacterium]